MRPTLRDLNLYRRSKRLSLDGSVPGLQYSRMRGGKHYATAPVSFGFSGQDFYDPVHAAYEYPDPDYDPAPAWFEGMHIPRTPFIRFPMQREHHRQFNQPVQYEDSLLTPEMTQQLFDESQQQGLEAPPHEQAQFSLEQAIAQPAMAEPMMEAGAMAGQEMNEDQLALEQRVQEMAPMPTPAPEPMAAAMEYGGAEMTPELFQQAMEQALEQQMPDSMPDPHQRMQELYDEQREMMMHPYMVPNPMMPGPGMMPGMGPMGPMPGP